MMAQWIGGPDEVLIPMAPPANHHRIPALTAEPRFSRHTVEGFFAGAAVVTASQGWLAPTAGAVIALTLTRLIP